jgi:hypothetical protein
MQCAPKVSVVRPPSNLVPASSNWVLDPENVQCDSSTAITGCNPYLNLLGVTVASLGGNSPFKLTCDEFPFGKLLFKFFLSSY